MRKHTTLLSWGSMGNFDDIENYLLCKKYPEEYTKDEKAETTSKLRLESCTTRNVLPKARNHGRYVQEVRRKRRESLSHAMVVLQVCKVTWPLYIKTSTSNLLECFFTTGGQLLYFHKPQMQ